MSFSSSSLALPTADKEDGVQDSVTIVNNKFVAPYPEGRGVYLPTTFTYYSDRYFTHYFIKDCKGVSGNNIRLLVHSNMICVLCLDPSHAIIELTSSLTLPRLMPSSQQGGVSSSSGDSEKQQHVLRVSHTGKRGRDGQIKDHSQISVKGKRKHNAAYCHEDTVLCNIELTLPSASDVCDSESEKSNTKRLFKIPAGVEGQVLEINPLLVRDPTVLVKHPLQEGYIACIRIQAKTGLNTKPKKIHSATHGELYTGCDDEM